MTADKPLRRSMARVEFLACKDTIDSMQAQGFSKKLIHERLIADGRCSMSYITFCEYIRNVGEKAPHPQQAEPRHQVSPPVRPQRQPGIIRVGPEPFPDPRNIDPKTLI